MAPENTPDEERLVQLAKHHAENKNIMKKLKRESAELWVEYLDSRVGLSEATREVVERQGRSRNCAKPIGIFRGEDDLLAETYPNMVDAGDGKRFWSFVESFWWHAESDDHNYPPVSQEAVIPDLVKIIEDSALDEPVDSREALLAHVEETYSEVRKLAQR